MSAPNTKMRTVKIVGAVLVTAFAAASAGCTNLQKPPVAPPPVMQPEVPQ